MLQIIIEALFLIFPAYCANSIPVIVGGGLPIDFDKSFFDGKPMFGKNKTYKGFFAGFLVGTIIGFLESLFLGYPFFLGLLLSLGALLGDLCGSFLKRRINLAPGDHFPVIDQLDFMIGAIVFSIPLNLFSLDLILVALTLTLPIHLFTNFIAYKLGLKKNPW